MNVIKIALLQLTSCGSDQNANRCKGEEFCRRAQKMGADIALFPEMWNIGYTAYDSKVWEAGYDPINISTYEVEQREEWQAKAVNAEDDYVVHFKNLARELNMAIGLTYLERWTVAPRNTLSVIDRHGQIVLTYAKVHTCDFSLEAGCAPGDDFYVSTLDTPGGKVEIGAMICYDREFPESARVLMLKGAEIILTPNSCELEQHRLRQFKTRAFENMLGLAMANYAAPQSNGHSMAVGPMAFDEQGHSSESLIVEADEEEGIYIAEFDMERMRSYRQRETWGNAYRKPRSYDLLTSAGVKSPFERKDARR